MEPEDIIENIKSGLRAKVEAEEQRKIRVAAAAARFAEIMATLATNVATLGAGLENTGAKISSDNQPREENLGSDTFSVDIEFGGQKQSLSFLRGMEDTKLVVRVYPQNGENEFRKPFNLDESEDAELLGCVGDFLSDVMGVPRIKIPYNPRRRIRNLDIT